MDRNPVYAAIVDFRQGEALSAEDAARVDALLDSLRTGWRWPNFTKAELACPCCGEYVHDPDFLDKLQALRTAWGRPMRINSGHRCEKHNTKVGGAKSSRHLKIAADISVSGLSVADRRKMAALATSGGFTGIGRGHTFLHVDNRPGARTEWFYGDSAKLW